VGGIVPPGDHEFLRAAGARGIFGPGTPILDCARMVLRQIAASQACV
jgi:methylmalonyl-CoA mutase